MKMLLKIIGCVIVVISSSFLGYVLSRDCSRRPQELREMQSLLYMLENEISYLSNLLSDAFEKIYKSSKYEVGEFFRCTVQKLENSSINASQAWEAAVKENIKKTSLNKEDESILISFGKILGSSDMEGQIKNIELTLKQLKLQENKAEQTKTKNESMYRKLGVLGGIAIVIILL